MATMSAKHTYMTIACISFIFVLFGAIGSSYNCYRPQNFKTATECALHGYVILEDKFVLVAMALAALALLLNVYNLLVFFGCFKSVQAWCEQRNYHYVAMALLFAIMTVVFVDIVMHKLNSVPASKVDNPTACLICPNSKSSGYIFAMYVGAIIAFANPIVVYFKVRKTYTTTKSSDIVVQLTGDDQ